MSSDDRPDATTNGTELVSATVHTPRVHQLCLNESMLTFAIVKSVAHTAHGALFLQNEGDNIPTLEDEPEEDCSAFCASVVSVCPVYH